MLVGVILVSFVLHLGLQFAAKEFLGEVTTGVVHDNTNRGGHVSDFATAVEEHILARISAPVAVDECEIQAGVRLFGVRIWVGSWLHDSANPGLHSHELLTLASVLSGEHIHAVTTGIFSVVGLVALIDNLILSLLVHLNLLGVSLVIEIAVSISTIPVLLLTIDVFDKAGTA